MSNQTIDALQAAARRIALHRKALRRAQVLCRVWPEGLSFICNLTMLIEGYSARSLFEAGGQELVPWSDLPSFDAAAAQAVVDRVCAKAHALLGTVLLEAVP